MRNYRYLFIFLFTFLFSGKLYADKYQPHKIGDKFEGYIDVAKGKYRIPLPEGKFVLTVAHKWRTKNTGTSIYGLFLVQQDGNTFKKIVNLQFSRPTTTWWLTPKTCKRTNMFFIEKYLKGKTYNCWFINHHGLEITSNKIKPNSYHGKIRDYFINSNIIKPNFSIYSGHLYASPRHKNMSFRVEYHVNPLKEGMSEVKKTQWKFSDYNIVNIKKFPKKEKYLEEYVQRTAVFQKLIEENISVRPEHQLNTSKYISQNIKKKKSKEKQGKSLTNELLKLNKLLKSGAITQDEFKKAKAKLLN